MARSRTRGRGRSQSKSRYDWVVNDQSYSRFANNIGGAGTVFAFPLTLPAMQQTMPIVGFGGADAGGFAFPQSQDRQFVKAVSGHMYYTPSGWAAGNSMTLWLRIVKKPMDWVTGDAIADSLYALDEAQFANERFVWQHIRNEAFNTGANFADNIRVKASVNQYLEPDEALFMIASAMTAGGISINLTLFLRTLMRV